MRGLAYGVNGSLTWYERCAVLVGGTATRADATAETIDVIEREFRKMAAEGPTEEEFDKAKSYLNGCVRAQPRHIDQDRRRSWCRCRSTISASTISSAAPP